MVLAPGATAADSGTVVVFVKTAAKPSKPVKNVEVFLGVTVPGSDLEARFKCTNRKGRAVFRDVPRNATLISATGPGSKGCKNGAFLFGKRPLLSQFYKGNNGRAGFDQVSLGAKASMRLNFRPITWPAHELCMECKFARQFDGKLRRALNLWYRKGKRAKAIASLKALRRTLVNNVGGRFDEPDGTQFWAPSSSSTWTL